jgi:hypothetical protein
MKVKVIYPIRRYWNEHSERVFDVGEIEASTALDACEMMFVGFNVVEPNPFKGEPGYYNTIHHCRSLSMGDIVEVDGVRYRCDAIGFREMDTLESNVYNVSEMFS